ncbi:MAG: hypothetical protein RBT65_10255 [Methanolobus sp.]|nr:hypothetical protein [Methanolobus sp.]
MNIKYILYLISLILFFTVISCNADENTPTIENTTYNFAPYWSPDGECIVYSSGTAKSPDNMSVYLINEDGTAKETLTLANESGVFFFDPWSPEGDLLLYISNLTGNYELWTMYPNGSGKRKLTEGAFLENYLLGFRGWEAAWSPDGSKIAYVSASSENGKVWDIVESEDETRQRLLNSSNICKESDIWVINSDGTENIKLTDSRGPYLEPQWQPGGDRIAYVSNNPENKGIWIIESDGSRKSRILKGNVYDIAWSPNGSEIAYVKTDQNQTTALWVTNVNGSKQRKISNDSGYFKVYSFPAWSPDGEKIVFNYGNIGEYGLWIMNRKGDNKIKIGEGLMPQWSPDRTKIAYTSTKEGNSSISVIELDKYTSDPAEQTKQTNSDAISEIPEKISFISMFTNIVILFSLYIVMGKK